MFERMHENHELISHYPADSETSAPTIQWDSIANFIEISVWVSVGDIATSGTFDAKLRQATDASGTGAKDITGASITQLTQAGSDSNKVVVLSVLAENLDVDNGFTHVGLVATPATAATEFAAIVFGVRPRHRPVATTAIEEVVTAT